MFWVSIIGFVLLLTVGIAALSFAPWVPMRRRDIERIFTLANLQTGETIYDLGCGDGRVVFAAAHRGAHAIGIELGIPLYLWCRIKRAVMGTTPASFRYANFFKSDITDADVVYLFGLPGKLGERLVGKFRRELKPGARVVSYAFPLEAGLVPVRVDKPSAGELALYLYQF